MTGSALVAPTGLGFVAEDSAMLAAGGVVVPIAPMLVVGEIEFQRRDGDACAVLVDPEFAAVSLTAAERARIPGRILSDHPIADPAPRDPPSALALRQPG